MDERVIETLHDLALDGWMVWTLQMIMFGAVTEMTAGEITLPSLWPILIKQMPT